MQTEILISGFGGQGVLFAGQLLAFAGMDSGYHVTWIPSYGPEMRGGTAHCMVVISDEEIGSPLVRNPKVTMIFNMPSLDRYEPLAAPGGVLVVNSTLMTRRATRTDIRVIEVPANEIAEEIGNARLANIVMTGAMLAATGVLSLDALQQALQAHLPERHRKLLPANYEAMRRGAAIVTAVPA